MGSYRDVAIGRMVAAGHLAGPDYLGSGIFVTTSIGDARLASESLYGICGRSPERSGLDGCSSG